MIRAGGVGAGSPAMAALERLDPTRPINEPRQPGSAAGSTTGEVDFASVLGGALSGAGEAERTASDAAARFAAGDPDVGIHEVMIAAEKANISVRYAVTLKNRAIEAYRELLNTPV